MVELAIRDLKEGAGLEHIPSGNFHANSAWLQCAVLAHNLTRWTSIVGDLRVDNQLIVTRTIRTRFLALPGRLVNRSGRPVLHLQLCDNSDLPQRESRIAVGRAAHHLPALTTGPPHEPVHQHARAPSPAARPPATPTTAPITQTSTEDRWIEV